MVPIREYFTTLATTLTNNKLYVLEDRDLFVYEFPSLDSQGKIETDVASTMVAIDNNILMMNGSGEIKFLGISNPSKPK